MWNVSVENINCVAYSPIECMFSIVQLYLFWHYEEIVPNQCCFCCCCSFLNYHIIRNWFIRVFGVDWLRSKYLAHENSKCGDSKWIKSNFLLFYVNEISTASTRTFFLLLFPAPVVPWCCHCYSNVVYSFIIITSEYRFHFVCVRILVFLFGFNQYFIYIYVSDMLDWPVLLTDTSRTLIPHLHAFFLLLMRFSVLFCFSVSHARSSPTFFLSIYVYFLFQLLNGSHLNH